MCSGRPPEVAYKTATSAFFNYAPRLTDDGHMQLYEETGLSAGGALIFSSAYLSDRHEPVRGLTNVVVDDRERLHRFTFGDALVSSGELGSGGFVGGVTLTRSYELDPYAIKVPTLGLQGSTPTPATLDVLVNGQRVHSQAIEPGTFQVENLLAGVVVPGAGIFPTLPVQGAYGLIRVPGVMGVRGYGNHQERGRTDAAGNLIVPNLIGYYGNHLSIAPEDVPIEYELDATSMTLAPPPRGVALAEFRARTIHYYRGRIAIDAAGTRSAPTYGQLTVYRVGDDVVSPLGEGGEFDLEGAEPGTRNALVEWSEGTCTLQIELPASEDPVIELGELVCRMPPAAE